MKNSLALMATGCALAFTGCASAPTIDAEAWMPASADYSPVPCSDLLPEWGTGVEESPVACWTFEETTGLPDRFITLVSNMTAHAGSEPVRGPGCMTTVSCQADWEEAEGTVTLAAGLTLTGLQAEVEAGIDAGPETPRLYELTIWASDEPVMSDEEWNRYFEPLAP